MARLQQLGEHWHEKLWNGSGPWAGDRFLNIYHHPLKDEIEVRYEVPNAKPEMVMQIALADFDIDKLCTALAKADNRQVSVADKLTEIHAHNDGLEVERAKATAERDEEFKQKMLWAVRKDTGSHIAPLSVPHAPGVVS